MTAVYAAADGIDEMLALVGGGWQRSGLFQFLREHHDRIVDRQDGERMNWRSLCVWFASAGLTNKRGEAPTPSCARKTWYRVRKLVTAAQRKVAYEELARQEARLADEARKAVLREAARAEVARKSGEDAKLKERMAAAERAAQWAREREAARLTETVALAAQPIVKIGDVKLVPQMLVAAPRYGTDRDKPLPPPYVGARPAGMPDNLPLEALVSLDATGVDENGNLDFKNMPGLPRRSFFEKEYEWVEYCMPMVKAVPPQDRSLALKFMFNWLKMFPGNR